MNFYQEKLNQCNNCPHEDYEINWYNEETGTGKLGAYSYPESNNSVMVVGQNPSHQRWKGVHSMQGIQGDIFRKIFLTKNLVFSNFVPVSTPNNKVSHLTKEEINHCIDHLLFEIEHLKPKVIIICSAFAKRKLIEHNRLHELTSNHFSNVVFVNHPDYYLIYKQGDFKKYCSELRSIKNSCL